MEDSHLDARPVGIRSTCNNLYHLVSCNLLAGEVPGIIKFGLTYKVPVDREYSLKCINSIALYLKMGISPKAKNSSVHVAVGNIHSTKISNTTVNYKDLAVITIVDLACQIRETYFQK